MNATTRYKVSGYVAGKGVISHMIRAENAHFAKGMFEQAHKGREVQILECMESDQVKGGADGNAA